MCLVRYFLHFSEFEHISTAVKVVWLQPWDGNPFLTKTTNVRIFSAANHKYKVFSAARRTPKFWSYSQKANPIHYPLKDYLVTNKLLKIVRSLKTDINHVPKNLLGLRFCKYYHDFKSRSTPRNLNNLENVFQM